MSQQLYKQLYYLFLKYNFRLRFIRRSLPFRLSRQDYFILHAIDDGYCQSANELGATLNIEKSLISRHLSKLEKQKLVTRKVDRGDKRRFRLALADHGKDLIRGEDKLIQEQDDLCLIGLSPKDRERLGLLLLALADNYNSPKMPPFTGFNSVNIAINRLTLSMGLIGDNFLHTKLPVEQCQIFRILAEADQILSMEQIRVECPYDFPALSRLISERVTEGYVVRHVNAKDSRRIQIGLSQKGEKTAVELCRRGAGRLAEGLTTLTSAQQKELVSLLQKFLTIAPYLESPGSGERFTVIRLLSEEQRQKARGFVVESYVHTGQHFSLPENIIASSSHSFGLFEAGTLKGVLEIVPNKRQPEVKLCVLTPELENRTARDFFLKKAQGLAAIESPL